MNELMAKVVRLLTAPDLIRHEILLASLFFVTVIVDTISRRGLQRYRSKSTAVDLAYFVFYYLGPYQLMLIPIFTPLSLLVKRYAPWMQVNAIGALPLPLRLLAFIVICDVLGYWLHRWQHKSPMLWAFHKVHHSQQSLTVLTNYRKHPLDEGFQRFFSFWLFLLTGSTPVTWAVADIVMGFILLMQHSGFTWTFGFFENLVISPRMHGLHHSAEAEHQNRNFGMFFAFWDSLFGTSLRRGEARIYGVEPPLPESLWQQFAVPFRDAFGGESVAPAPVAPPQPDAAA